MSVAVACRCVRCAHAERVKIPLGVDPRRYLATYKCGSCGLRQVRPDERYDEATLPGVGGE